MYRSVDGGKSFKFDARADRIPGNLYTVKFFDDKTGFALGSDGVLMRYQGRSGCKRPESGTGWARRRRLGGVPASYSGGQSWGRQFSVRGNDDARHRADGGGILSIRGPQDSRGRFRVDSVE